MNRTLIAAGSVVAVLATGGVLAVSGGAQAPGGQTIRLITKNYVAKMIDTPPRRGEGSFGSGDRFVSSAYVVNAAGRRRGTFDADCAVTRGGFGRFVCDGVYVLSEGHIFVQMRFSFVTLRSRRRPRARSSAARAPMPGRAGRSRRSLVPTTRTTQRTTSSRCFRRAGERRRPDSNRSKRLCRPLRSHSATAPRDGERVPPNAGSVCAVRQAPAAPTRRPMRYDLSTERQHADDPGALAARLAALDGRGGREPEAAVLEVRLGMQLFQAVDRVADLQTTLGLDLRLAHGRRLQDAEACDAGRLRRVRAAEARRTSRAGRGCATTACRRPARCASSTTAGRTPRSRGRSSAAGSWTPCSAGRCA